MENRIRSIPKDSFNLLENFIVSILAWIYKFFYRDLRGNCSATFNLLGPGGGLIREEFGKRRR
jgi:hypothetical protein